VSNLPGWIILNTEGGNSYAGTVDRRPVFGKIPARFHSYADVARRFDALRKSGYSVELSGSGAWT
jgi:hypothetical protein